MGVETANIGISITNKAMEKRPHKILKSDQENYSGWLSFGILETLQKRQQEFYPDVFTHLNNVDKKNVFHREGIAVKRICGMS